MKRSTRCGILVAISLAVVINGTVQAASPRPESSGPVPLPDTGALFGVHLNLDAHNGLERRQAMTDFEALVGRTMDIDRQFYSWVDFFPTADDYWSRDQGRILYLSWNAGLPNGTCVLWADVAAGVYDLAIHEKAAAIEAFGAPLLFSFHHEPTTAPPSGEPCGTPEEYIAAWRHIHDLFVADGVTNVSYALTMTALSYQNDMGDVFYPGDDVIDVIAADGYNWYSCEFHPGEWREPVEIFRSFYEFGLSKDKPMVIAEYGTGEHDVEVGKKGQWFANVADQMKRWPEIKGVSYFNVGNGGACDRYVDSSESSLRAFRVNGSDPYFNPPVPTTPVEVADFSFTPRDAEIGPGTIVEWTFQGPSAHTATDRSGMNLFDSGARQAGSSYRFFFIGAGTYRYACRIHPTQMNGIVKVPTVVRPLGGEIDTRFTVTWAANHAPSDYRFDIQIRRPGSGWTDWLVLQSSNSARFIPDAGVGAYSFKARYHNAVNGRVSAYSDPVTIPVG